MGRRERWSIIPDFPYYQVSDFGNIYNARFRQPMKTSMSNKGYPKITLTSEHGVRHDRSIAQLVAEAFVEPPNRRCDHIIRLDGDLTNVQADNLAWRPRSFAWEYMHQLRVHQPVHFYNLRLRNVITRKRYKSIIDAGMAEGLLFKDIWRSTYSGAPVYPHGSVFEIIQRV